MAYIRSRLFWPMEIHRASIGWLLLLRCMVPAAAENPRPNVILIYTDDQGYGDVSCLNDEAKFATPNLDRIAREGITFTDAHCSDTVCTPSRYGLLTGRYSWRTELKRGVFGAERRCLIDEGRMTLASLLRDHGYATAMVGKWHLGMEFPGQRGRRDWSQPVLDMPLDKGFDFFFGIPASLNYGILAWFEGRHAAVPPTMYTEKKANRLAIDDYRIAPPYDANPRELGGTDHWGLVKGQIEVAPDFVDAACLTRFTDRALDWIETQSRKSEQEAEPFFLYLAYTSPHKPVIPIEAFRGKSAAGAYGDFMMETDWHIGRILDLLDRLQLADQTLLVVSSDNGPETTWRKRVERYGHRSNGIYREGKRSIYEGGHRVPFLVRWPQRVKAGVRHDGPICQTDLLATLAEMLGSRLPDSAGEDSVSFYPALVNSAMQPERPPIIHHSARGGFAIRAGKWKLVMPHQRQPLELYDLQADPSETNNLAAQHPEVVDRLTQQISQVVQRGRTTEGAVQENDQAWWNDLTWMKAP